MNAALQLETEKLIHSWMQHDSAHLRDYLVATVEDPRINLQSIFTRHFLLRELFPGRFEALLEEECRFAAVMNWAAILASDLKEPEVRQAILHALRQGADNAEGIPVAPFVTQAFQRLPQILDSCAVPNYLRSSLARPPASGSAPFGNDVLNTFQGIWSDALRKLSNQTACRPTVLEPACGSANDYRFLVSYGIAQFIDYSGFDLCEKNVLNARAMFPQINFETGNVFEISAADASFDLCIVHDLLEHLSIEGMHAAVQQLCRVTRRGLCIGFFQMHEGAGHIVRQIDEYHWNTLSLPRMRDLFAENGFEAQAYHIGSFLRQKFGCECTHNPDAYTLLLRSAPVLRRFSEF